MKSQSRDFELRTSRIYGIGGVDGAGKSIFLRALAGLIDPHLISGKIDFLGQDLLSLSLEDRKKIGVEYLSPDIAWITDFNLQQNLKLLYGETDVQKLGPQLGELMQEAIDLEAPLSHFADEQRILLLLAFFLLRTKPKLLLLDEPSRGFSRKALRKFNEILEAHRKSGASVLYAAPAYIFDVPQMDELLWMDHEQIESKAVDQDEGTQSIRIQLSQSGPKSKSIFPQRRSISSEPNFSLQLQEERIEFQKAKVLGLFDARSFPQPEEVFEELKARADSDNFYFVSGRKRRDHLFPNISAEFNLSIASLLKSPRSLRTQKESYKLWKHYSEILQLPREASLDEYSKLDLTYLLVARVLALKPDLLFFEELSRGLNLIERQALYSFIRRLSDSDAVVVWQTRELEELQFLCHEILILHDKKVFRLDAQNSIPKKIIEAIQWHGDH